jgi:hypothetical protein
MISRYALYIPDELHFFARLQSGPAFPASITSPLVWNQRIATIMRRVPDGGPVGTLSAVRVVLPTTIPEHGY